MHDTLTDDQRMRMLTMWAFLMRFKEWNGDEFAEAVELAKQHDELLQLSSGIDILMDKLSVYSGHYAENQRQSRFYGIAKDITLESGMPYTDPRTGQTFHPKEKP